MGGNWVENDSSQSATAGNIQVTGNLLRIGDNFGSGSGKDSIASVIYREIDLSEFDAARLTFNWQMTGVETGKSLVLEISNNGGSSWTVLDTFKGNSSGADTGFESYPISDYIATKTQIRFRSVNFDTTTTTDYFYIDRLQIEGSQLGDLPKNTARWVITIPKARIADNKKLTIETRLGDTLTTGVMYPPESANVPPNLSRTYVWRGTDTWIFGDGTTTNQPNFPITEQFQFLGDPRHLPYADLKRPHVGAGFGATYENRLGMGYNRYFDDFESAGSGNLTAVEIRARDPRTTPSRPLPTRSP